MNFFTKKKLLLIMYCITRSEVVWTNVLKRLHCKPKSHSLFIQFSIVILGVCCELLLSLLLLLMEGLKNHLHRFTCNRYKILFFFTCALALSLSCTLIFLIAPIVTYIIYIGLLLLGIFIKASIWYMKWKKNNNYYGWKWTFYEH